MSRFPMNEPNDINRPRPLDYATSTTASAVAAFFNIVYAWMAAGLGLTALVAWVVSRDMNLMRTIFHPGVLLILIIAELALVVVISAATQKVGATMATVLFMIYAGLNGLTLSAIFLVYARASIVSAFLVTGGMFGAVSVWGFVTRRDLSAMGRILFMALIGLILATVVNLFVASSGLYWIINYAGVAIFVGLTAYDTQKLKMIAVQTENDPSMAARLAVYGALALYLDFINLFLFLLRILGRQRN